MNPWLKFIGCIIGSFSAVWVCLYLDTQRWQRPPPVAAAQTVRMAATAMAAQDLAATEAAEPEDGELVDGAFVIHGDSRGHFRGNVLVNGINMPFLIDTGATTTTLPFKLAKQANLPIGEQNIVETANGIALGQKSRIAEMKLGNAVLKDTEADINYSLNEVLIGMTTLKHFQVSLESNTLKLIPNKGYGDTGISVDAATKTWQKKVVCGSDGQNCKTVYSH
jgi:clan AA aspartic protease (TIGR02281 family)